MRNLVTGLLLLTVALGFTAPARGDTPATRSPNVVLILVDDLGWADLTIAGNDLHETPHIDSLARRGMYFTQSYSNSPNCSPSRASILTGQYPARHGIVTVGKPKKKKFRDSRTLEPVGNRPRFDVRKVGLFALFRAAGYSTACIGKSHLTPAGEPAQLGCDLSVERQALGYDRLAHTRQVESTEGGETEYLVDRLTDEALRFIDDRRADPFFLYLSYYSVHVPFEAKPDKVAKYAAKLGTADPHRATYAAMVEEVDDGVGRIVGRLDELDLDENTVIIFTSDNGPAPSVPSPSSGAKGTLHEGGIRVPLIVVWPGHGKARATSDVPVLGMDIYATLIDIAELPPPQGHAIDGVSLAPLLEGRGRPAREAVFWHVPADTHYSPPTDAVLGGGWKLLERLDDGSLELFHLAQDPAEQTNLSRIEPAKAEEMRALLHEWREAIGAPMPTPRADSADTGR